LRIVARDFRPLAANHHRHDLAAGVEDLDVPKADEPTVGERDELVNFGGWGFGHWFSSNEIAKSYTARPGGAHLAAGAGVLCVSAGASHPSGRGAQFAKLMARPQAWVT
jgi:hypothetical protein